MQAKQATSGAYTPWTRLCVGTVGTVDALAIVRAGDPSLETLAVFLETLRLLAVTTFVVLGDPSTVLPTCGRLRAVDARCSTV
jgi:hypothetical protein